MHYVCFWEVTHNRHMAMENSYGRENSSTKCAFRKQLIIEYPLFSAVHFPSLAYVPICDQWIPFPVLQIYPTLHFAPRGN